MGYISKGIATDIRSKCLSSVLFISLISLLIGL